MNSVAADVSPLSIPALWSGLTSAATDLGAAQRFGVFSDMRYLVKARVKPGKHRALFQAIQNGSLGKGSVAGDEYVYDMQQARLGADGTTHWVETCFCATPLQEERPYWEEYFDLLSVKDAHNRKNCRHENGTEPWACSNCDCTNRLEVRLQQTGKAFLEDLQRSLKLK